MGFEIATTFTDSSDLEVEAVGQMAQGPHKFNLEQRRDDSPTSAASPELSSKVRPSDSDKFSAPPGSPIYTTGTITSTGPTNFGIAATRTKDGSFSANNPNTQSSLYTTLNLNHAVRDGSLNVGMNSMSVADGGMPKGVFSDTTSGSGLLTTTRSVVQAFSRLQARGSDPIPSIPAPRTSDRHGLNPQAGPNANINLPFRSPSPSHFPSRSRAASPLPEEWCYPSSSSPLDVHPETGAGPGCDAISGPGTSPSPSFNSSSNGSYNPNLKFINVTSNKSFCEAACLFLSDILPRLVYHNFLLLRFPAMYSSRAVMYSLRAARMAELDLNSQGGGGGGAGVDSASGTPFHGGSGRWVSGFSGHQGTAEVSGAAANGFDYWEALIDSLLREWKTLNLVSALLIPTLLAILQIPEAADDLITRSTALLSLVCALMSLLYACIYIVRFGTMRSMYRASRWAEEARRANTAIWWNVWVLLAMPAVSMAWSMLFFITCILSFIWLTGSGNDPSSHAPLSATAVLGSRVAITGVLMLGLVYLAMILTTLMRYGKEWGEMRTDVEMGTRLRAVSVQGEEPERREEGTRRRGGADRHVEEEA